MGSRPEALQPGDRVEYSLTEEVSLGRGCKAWVKFGVSSTVRDGETTEDAIDRIAAFVNSGLDARINDLS